MTGTPSTVLLRLEAPMQSWGDGSRFQIRRTADAPTKSGVLGLVLCAAGIGRRAAGERLAELRQLRFAVRIDRPGVRGWDYHTAGAGYGILSAEGVIKRTATTREPETLLSRREFLFDASFVAGLEGETSLVERIAGWLADPVWPVFLGRKSCVPTRPVLEGVARSSTLLDALAEPPWRFGMDAPHDDTLRVLMDAPVGDPLPKDAKVAYDVPRALGVMDHAQRWIVETTVKPRLHGAVPADTPPSRAGDRPDDWWTRIRKDRLAVDHGLCVFCKAEADEVHHVTYERRGQERVEDLRSLCRTCHDACTSLEYGSGLTLYRVDPIDPAWRERITAQIDQARLAGAAITRKRVSEALASVPARIPAPNTSV